MIWIHATTGRGPEECDIALQQFQRIMEAEAKASDLTFTILEAEKSRHGLASFIAAVEGDCCEEFAKIWNGTYQWICKSSIRYGHKRKRWFVKFEAILPKQIDDVEIKDSDLVWTSFRSSGPGGQNVQKTDSAVRLTHKPSGVTVTAQEERSQHRNKSLALAKLYVCLRKNVDVKKAQTAQERWKAHNNMERGNAVRTFQGIDFEEVNK